MVQRYGRFSSLFRLSRRRLIKLSISVSATVVASACGTLSEQQNVLTSSTRTSDELIVQTAATARAVAGAIPAATAIPLQREVAVPGIIARPPQDIPPPTSTSRPSIPSQSAPNSSSPPTTILRVATPITSASPASVSGPTATTVRLTHTTVPSLASGPTATPFIRKNRTVNYVALGASDTVGVGATNPDKDGWVSRIHQKLAPGSRIVNLGISGARLSDLVAKQLAKAIEAKPDIVTLWSVVNDINANVDIVAYERDLLKMLGDLTARTNARIVVGNAPDLALVPAYSKLGIPLDTLRAETSKWNQVIARVVRRYPDRAFLVDLHARSGEIEMDPSLVAGDDFHPSARGYAKLADVFWEFMVANHVVEG